METDAVAYLGRVRVSGTRAPSTRSGEIALAIGATPTSSPIGGGPNLKSEVRAALQVELLATGRTTVVINGIIPDDPQDPHVWQPSNFADVVAFVNAVRMGPSLDLAIATTNWVLENSVNEILVTRETVGSGDKVTDVTLSASSAVEGSLTLTLTVTLATDRT